MSRRLNALQRIITVIEDKLQVKEVKTSLVDNVYQLEVTSNKGKVIKHFISKYDIDYLYTDTEVYYYTRVVVTTVSKLLENA